jgi:hypothetical protein
LVCHGTEEFLNVVRVRIFSPLLTFSYPCSPVLSLESLKTNKHLGSVPLKGLLREIFPAKVR